MKRLLFASLLISAIFLAFPLPARSQSMEDNPNVREYLDEMFRPLDKTKVPTGLLRDYAFELVDLDRYDGSSLSDSNYVEKNTFEYLLRSIRSSAVAEKPFGLVSGILDDMYAVDDGTMAIGFMLFKYNYIREDALDNNLIRYVGGQVYDNYDDSGQWINPYAEKYVMGFSSYSSIIQGSSVRFSFPERLMFTNVEISKIEFDPGDGNGYRTVSPGGTIDVAVGRSTRELRMRVTLSTGEVLVSHGKMISTGPRLELQHTTSGSYTIARPDMEKSFSLSTKSGLINAKVSVFYADNNSLSQLHKPFIVVEGYDPMDFVEYYLKTGGILNQDSYYDDFGFTNAGSIYQETRTVRKDYDLVYIDWFNCEADIRDNARLLVEILKWINDEKVKAESEETNVLVGQSMGGLISRYALCKMEQEGTRHSVSTFVSHDVPYRGANIPVGLLYAAHSLLSFYSGGALAVDLINLLTSAEDIVKSTLKYLYSVSARQMLFNFVDERGQIDNSVHDSWQADLDAMGFPKGDEGSEIMNLAVVNGGETVELDGLTNYLHLSGTLNSGLFFDKHWLFSGLLISAFIGKDINYMEFVPGKTNVFGALDVYPYSAPSAMVSDAQIIYTKKILWLFNVRIPVFSQTHYAPSSSLTFDVFPGSYYGIPDILSESADSWGGMWLLSAGYEFSVQDKFMFIPTASALDIGMGNKELSYSDYTRKYWPDIPLPLAEMPFHAVLADEDASYHISTVENMYEWIIQQADIYISGPISPKTGDVYVLENYDNSVTWSTSDPSKAEINASTGEITVKSTGSLSIIAEFNPGHGQMQRRKTIMAGLPDFYLDISKESQIASVTAKCRTYGNVFKLLVDAGEIEYEWGVKDGDSPIEWTIQKDSVFVLGAPATRRPLTIYMRVRTLSGVVSTFYSYEYTTYYPFTFSPKFIVSNSSGELFVCNSYSIKKVTSENDWPLSLNIKFSRLLDSQDIYPGTPYKIIVNGDREHYWFEYPGGQSMDVGLNFYLFDRDEFEGYRQQMKPWGDTEVMVFSVLVQDSEGKDMMTAPVVFAYIEDFDEYYSVADMVNWYFEEF